MPTAYTPREDDFSGCAIVGVDLVPLPAEKPAVRRFVEDLSLTYRRELTAVVDAPTLAEGVDVVSEEVEYRPDRLTVGDLYVREPERGSGLAGALIDRARERGRTNARWPSTGRWASRRAATG